jgi:hypothetical protein
MRIFPVSCLKNTPRVESFEDVGRIKSTATSTDAPNGLPELLPAADKALE